MILFSVIGLIFPTIFLFGVITDKFAFPIMFTCIGGQQICSGLMQKDKNTKIFFVLFGIFLIIYVVFRMT